MVKSLISLLSSRQKNILTGATILMFAVFMVKFLGLIKSRLLLHYFDTSTTDIYIAAFSMPDFLFQLVVFGAISVAFIPIYTEYLQEKGEEPAFRFASNLLNLMLLIFGVILIISFIFTPFLNSLFVPGFEGEKKALTDQLTRIILGSELLLVLGSFLIALSHSYQRFIIPALAPLFYNLGIILGIVILSPLYGIAGPAIGAVFGAFLHILVQVPLMKSIGFKYRFSLDLNENGIKEMLQMMSFRNISLIAEQINERVNIALASLVGNSAVTLLALSQYLYLVPISLFANTLAQAALPVLSQEQAKKEKDSFKFTLLNTMHQILFLTLPAAAILIVLRIPVVRLVFGASQFGWDDTVLTGRTVAFLSLGLTAQGVTMLLVRAFYAMKDLKTPAITTIIITILNIGLSMLFIKYWNMPVWSLGLSFAICSNLTFFILMFYLNRKVGGFDQNSLVLPALKMLIAAATAAVALYIPIKALDQLVFDTTRTTNLVMLTGIASTFGLGVYILLVWLMDIKELQTFVNLIKKTSHVITNIRTPDTLEDTNKS